MVARKDPLQELLNIQERINRLFEESLGRGSRDDLVPLGSGGWIPLADVYETPQSFVVMLEIPGLQRDDVEIGVADTVVTVKGERHPSGSARPESFYRMERSYGAFVRSFRFAHPIDTARVTAQLTDGLLRLELPKAPRPEGRPRPERLG